ncbi:efflux RND transporter permease subunit [Planktosalinus lacus]|uniref:Acriflavin resistance protein n=1 Tax=Planktosalinus lacus TaxID=1526573 RepID=A0A8J2V828_9FLAO|nr:efflux RND transporter permease subunit [Planktosalinus lacus]GGD86332.1 acriflavin resistance protein [Planktosalinus lacus]
MRKVIEYFIKYSVAVNVVIFAFIIFGIFGVSSLKSSFFPLVDSEIININITYPAASPQEIEEGIIIKIEDNLKGLEGIERVTSTARESGGSITIETARGENIDVILAEVKNAVDRVPSFPADMEPLVVSKQIPVRETISFAVSGTNIPLATLKQIARSIENDLRVIPGISQIEITGYPAEEIEISVRENDLLAYNLTFQEVAQAVRGANIFTTGGTIKTDVEDYLIRANNRGYFADELDNIVVRSDASGTIIRLKDVASVRDRFSETPNATFFNGNLSVNITISNTNDEDLISTAANVNQYIEEFNQKNNNIRLDVVNDSSISLNQRTQILVENGAMGILLVLFFLSFFLNTRVAFWVAFGLPIAFMGMFMLAPFFGVTINILSLFGMIIVIGILVDDGIVISENIYQHYEKGKGPVRAAIDGTLEVMPPILSAIITTVLAFLTFQFLDSRIGKFYAEVSVVVILTLIISLVEAFIILPAHIAHSKALVRKTGQAESQSTLDKFFGKLRILNKLGDQSMRFLRDKFYSPVLAFILKNNFLSLAVIVAVLMLTVASIMGGIIKVTIFPSIASDRVSVNLLLSEGVNPATTDSIISYVEAKAWEVNEEFTKKQTGNLQVIQNIIKRVGPGNNKASLDINLLPGENRDFSSPEITTAIRDAVGPVYGVEQLTFGSGGSFGGSPVSVAFLGNNTEQLKAAKEELKAHFLNDSRLKDVTDTDPQGIKEIRVVLNQSAYALGLTLNDVMQQIRAGFFGAQAQRFQRGQDEIRVWVRYDREGRSSINDLNAMRIVTPTGDRVPFGEIATYTIERGDESIRHLDGKREIQVNADLENPNDSATEILFEIQQGIIPEILSKYSTVSVSYEGQNREAQKLSNSASSIIPIILFLIYATIAFTFRSYSQPLLLLLLIPFSVIGVAWGHWIHGFPVNMLSAMGIIALIGIMVNDGLVLITKFNSFLKEGLDFDKALYEAGRARFRAIFLTSLTTIAGLAPLLMEKSRQAQFLKPMAISIAYGIGIATVLTLFLLPLFLTINNKIKTGTFWLATGKKVNKEDVERAIKEKRLDEKYDD